MTQEQRNSGESKGDEDVDAAGGEKVESLYLHYRGMRKADLPSVARIERESYSGRDAWTRRELADLLSDPVVSGGVVAEVGGNLIVGEVIYEESRNKFSIWSIAVQSEFRRIGFGRMIVDQIKSQCSPRRRRSIEAMVPEDNLAAQLFFRKCGFICRAIVRRPYKDRDCDGLSFVWRLDWAGADSSEAESCNGKPAGNAAGGTENSADGDTGGHFTSPPAARVLAT